MTVDDPWSAPCQQRELTLRLDDPLNNAIREFDAAGLKEDRERNSFFRQFLMKLPPFNKRKEKIAHPE